MAHDVTVEIDRNRDSCRVEGRFHAAVPVSVAWKVLTDYDGIPRFVHSVIASRTERTSEGGLRVHQSATAGVFLFHQRVSVTLAISERSLHEIVFRDVLGKDFLHYAGRWRLSPDSSGATVQYSLWAEPKGAIARRMCRGVLRKSAEELLSQVRIEMLRVEAARTNLLPPTPSNP